MESLSFGERLKHAWDAFTGNDNRYKLVGSSYSFRPDRPRLTRGNERTLTTSVYNRIALDCAAIKIQHVRLDENDRFLEVVDSGLNYCLTTEANIDQTGRAFIQDVVLSMLDEGVVAIVPTETSDSPIRTGNFEIHTMRTAKITEWYPEHVRLNLYNQKSGKKEDIILPKSTVAIVENPMFTIINEPNSTMQRLVRKLSLLDVVDEESSSGKLNLIIGLPYLTKSEARKAQAERRREEIRDQLASDKYGIAYTDGTEKITQLNRPLENNLMAQIEYLTNQLYSQLGLTTEILNGTADEAAMLNYYSRTIEPIIAAITDEMKRKFLTKTARSPAYRQSVEYFRDPFSLVPVNQLAELADKFTRNEIMTSNEIRQIVGMRPSDDPNADVLRNKNLNQTATDAMLEGEQIAEDEEANAQNENDDGLSDEERSQALEELDLSDKELDRLLASLE